MGAVESATDIVRAFAWPLIVFCIVLLLRKPLGSLMKSDRVKRVKAGPTGVELEYFDRQVEKAFSDLGVSPPEPAQLAAPEDSHPPLATSPLDDFIDDMRRLAEVAPSAVVLESFSRLEAFLRRQLEPELADQEHGRRFGIRQLVRLAVDRGLLSSAEASAVNESAYLRNIIAHERTPMDLGADRALEYAELVRQVAIAVLVSRGRTVLDMDDF